jgi:hypothetical protein
MSDLSLTSNCAFGYTLTKLPTAEWTEISANPSAVNLFPLSIDIRGYDDATSSAKNIGFDFPYFENSITQVVASTNGFLFMSGASQDNSYAANAGIPSEYPPNNIIASFWDDLAIGPANGNDGTVYFLAGGSGNPAVIEWTGVSRYNHGSDLLNFEVKLYPNGDIILNYAALNGDLTSATVGIEDSDGLDGCQLLYNAAGLGSNESYTLSYPTGSYRGKTIPTYQGGFLTGGSALYPITIKNTGTASDTFTFEKNTKSGWKVAVLNSSSQEISITPTLAAGGSYAARVLVTAPSGSTSGAYFNVQVDVRSTNNPAQKSTIRIDAAVPAPFTIFYIDSPDAYLGYYMPHQQRTTVVNSFFSGSTLGLSRTAGWNYHIDLEFTTGATTSLLHTIANPLGQSAITALFDNASNPGYYDKNAAAALAQNGTTGIFFEHRSGQPTIYNLYYAGINPSGSLSTTAVHLTSQTDANIQYKKPAVTALGNQFLVAYEKRTSTNPGANNDIGLVVVDTTGAINGNLTPITDAQSSGGHSYSSPAVANLSAGAVLIAYLSLTGSQYDINTQIRAANGTLTAGPTISDVGTAVPRMAVMQNGTVLLAWVRADTLAVNYARISPAGVLLDATPQALDTVNNTPITQLSLTGDTNGTAVLTWLDGHASNNYYLYYALVGPEGTLTPPMAFIHRSSNTNLIFSETGRGVAPLNPFWLTNFPVVVKQ